MSNPKFKFYYLNGVSLESKSRTLKDAIQFVFEAPDLKNQTPIKMVFESTGKTLYFDDSKFRSFLEDKIELDELIKATECDGLYRNNEAIEITKRDVIDSGFLWKLKNGNYILIDDDRYLPIKAPNNNFTLV